jgi:protein SCO1/2
VNFAVHLSRTIALSLAAGFVCVAAAADTHSRDPEHDYDAPAPGSYSLPVIKSAAGGALIDSSGRSVDLRELTRGRITVLSFIYTRCAAPRACPYATNLLGQIQLASNGDVALVRNMRLVSVSFDPEHDTPQRLADYAEVVRETKAGCEWDFATPKSKGELNAILNGYGQIVDKRENPADPQGPLYHVLRVFLIDAKGRVRNIYSSGTFDPRLVLADVKTLLLERAKLSVY